MKIKCEDCKYWQYVQLDGDEKRIGICRRHAPRGMMVRDIEVNFEWPFVSGDSDWCGEFKKP